MRCIKATKWLVFSLAFVISLPQAQAADEDALALESSPEAPPMAAAPWRIAVEGATGQLSGAPSDLNGEAHRLSLDLRYTAAFAPQWRINVSDRYDEIRPVALDGRGGRNSLREAYVTWVSDDARTQVEAGRINLRLGSSYGFNPTDFFRAGAVRTVTSANPIALRENRLGSLMVRVSHTTGDTAWALAAAPKVGNGQPDANPSHWSTDLSSTNRVDRLLGTADFKLSPSANLQALALLGAGQGLSAGLNGSALLGESMVAFGEWASLRSDSAGAGALFTAPSKRVQAFSAGLTATVRTGTSLTAELEYNGAGLNRQERSTALLTPLGYARWMSQAQVDQSLSAKRAALVYLSHKGLGLKQLDLLAFVRQNLNDQSRLAWVELRHHWSSFDLALQLQQASGASNTEYGTMPYRRLLQVSATCFF